ncbi:facilitated trehalose transporter Tret1-like [Contarinia nasturtii]|uniref:facilitated trehalose transporter Tret1-like n=1 Tax=Contarinia nasturtii TaxID=265458 RepID=UPI0012D3A417|nr:facilitated trehalose transporter Tret1-like [Contarinia nasturtii]
MQEASVKFQYFAAFVVNLLTVSYGITLGWPSPNILLLISDESPLPSGKITLESASWIASLLGVGALFGNLFFGFIINKFGRKMPLLLLSIPTIISWLLIWFAQNIYYLHAARTLIGVVGGGVFVIVPLFLSEIASDRVRGFLGSTFILSANFGILLAFVIGNYCDFYTSPKVAIVLMIVYIVLFYFFPESPTFLAKQGNLLAAEDSIRFYRGIRENYEESELLQLEMAKLKNSVGDTKSDQNHGNSFILSDLSENPARKAITIGIVLVILNQFSGFFAMTNYTGLIFKEADSTLPPNISAIIVATVQIVGSYMASLFVDRAGRKFLFAVSAVGMAVGLVVLGVYMMLKSWQYHVESVNWIPIVAFSFVIFIASWGIASLPFLIIAEIMPENVKDFGVTFCTALMCCFTFIIVKCLPLLSDVLGFHGTMFLFAAVCLCSELYLHFNMPETKGKSYEQIMDSLQ